MQRDQVSYIIHKIINKSQLFWTLRKQNNISIDFCIKIKVDFFALIYLISKFLRKVKGTFSKKFM